MSKLTLITCTGDRPEAFSHCQRYMAQQTCQDFRWIVVDDGKYETACLLDQNRVRLPPAPNPKESFRANYTEALRRIDTPFFLVIEDDDWYSRWYVEAMLGFLQSTKRLLVGETRAKYYHVRYRAWKVHGNTRHASLCQTAFRTLPVRDMMLSYLQASPNPQQLDGAIWKRSGLTAFQTLLLPSSTYCVALKGLPGRRGLGIDHTQTELAQHGYASDPDADKLRLWIDSDAGYYEAYYENLAAG